MKKEMNSMIMKKINFEIAMYRRDLISSEEVLNYINGFLDAAVMFGKISVTDKSNYGKIVFETVNEITLKKNK